MKKINLLIIGIIWCLSANSQQGGQVISVKNIVDINLPKEADKVNKTKRNPATTSKVRLSEIDPKKYPGDFYKINTMLIVVNSSPINNLDQDHLKKWKAGVDELYLWNKSYTSSLKKINNNEIFIMSYDRENTSYHRVICHNSTRTKSLRVAMESDISDKEKAAAVLEDLIKSIKFK